MAMVLGEGLRSPAHNEVSPKPPDMSGAILLYSLPNRSPLPLSAFPSEFALSEFTPTIKELVAIRQYGFIHSEEEREELLKVTDDIFVAPHVQNQRRENFKEANKWGLVEVGRTYYFDTTKQPQQIELSEPFFGNGEFARSNMNTLLERGIYPTIPMHQHWEDLPPSYDDYVPHIFNPYDRPDGRWAKIAITVGQKRQWVTIVTTDTKLPISKGEIEKNYLVEWEKRYEQAGYDEAIRLENAKEIGVLVFESTDMDNFKRVS